MDINPVVSQPGQLKWIDLRSSAGAADAKNNISSTSESSRFAAILGEKSSSGDGHVRTSQAQNGLLWQRIGDAATSISGEIAEAPAGPTAYEQLIQTASAKYGVPVDLIKAVIDTESSFNPNLVSSAGAKGLMQLMDGTAEGLGVSDPLDPAQSIDGGVRYLSYQLKRFNGQENMALAAYNAGPNRVIKLGVGTDEELLQQLDKLPEETQAYISKIERARAKYAV